MPETVLITGGAGFIGTHLIEALAKKGGLRVRVLDLRSPKRPLPSVDYIQGDVRDPATTSRALEGVTAVFHLAALVSVPLCQEQPLESYRTNTLSTVLLLEQINQINQARKASSTKPIRLIYSSSAAVYGAAGKEGVPLREEETAPHPLSFYSAQKLASEHAIALFHQSRGVPAIVFRFFNVYGPGQDPNSPYSGVISIFSKALKQGEPLRLFGGGTQTRDFVSVHDIVRACIAALTLEESRCDGSPFNLGSGHLLSIRTLAEEMSQAAGKKTKILEAPPRVGDVPHSLASIEKAEKILGWAPNHTLQPGLQELLQ